MEKGLSTHKEPGIAVGDHVPHIYNEIEVS
jgi:hypothetical protein